MDRITLGDRVKDTITGFEGIVIGISSWLNGCRTIGIKPEKLHEGKPIESVWFDEPRIKTIKERVSEVVPPNEGVE